MFVAKSHYMPLMSRGRLFEQLQPKKKPYLNDNMKQSTLRVFQYVSAYTGVNSIFDINKDVLIGYIKYHQSINFCYLPLNEVIKDIKLFISFFEMQYGDIHKAPSIDLSISNCFLILRTNTKKTT
ncbi:hypothetical protein HRF87_05725 [Bacillus sp. CRN 9]|nr:hypothetical protein [Bacillus sp. CRN 9]